MKESSLDELAEITANDFLNKRNLLQKKVNDGTATKKDKKDLKDLTKLLDYLDAFEC